MGARPPAVLELWRIGAALLAVAASTVIVDAGAHSQLSEREGSRFRSGVDLVALSVTVTDPRGAFVRGLTPDDFHVFEDGVRREIEFFRAGEIPVDLTLLIDSSRSMTGRMPQAQEAAANFIRSLGPADRASVMSFGSRIQLLRSFTTDRNILQRDLSGLTPSGRTALHDAIYVALRSFDSLAEEAAIRRRALVVLSDGRDTSSLMSFDTVLELAHRFGVPTYVISLRMPSEAASRDARFSSDDFAMRKLAAETGGLAFFTADIAKLSGVYASIADELSHQYSLAFIPSESAEKVRFRKLGVRVNRPDARTRTRSGYVPG